MKVITYTNVLTRKGIVYSLERELDGDSWHLELHLGRALKLVCTRAAGLQGASMVNIIDNRHLPLSIPSPRLPLDKAVLESLGVDRSTLSQPTRETLARYDERITFYEYLRSFDPTFLKGIERYLSEAKEPPTPTLNSPQSKHSLLFLTYLLLRDLHLSIFRTPQVESAFERYLAWQSLEALAGRASQVLDADIRVLAEHKHYAQLSTSLSPVQSLYESIEGISFFRARNALQDLEALLQEELKSAEMYPDHKDLAQKLINTLVDYE